MKISQIRAAIAADPALKKYADAGNTQAIADALSAGRTQLGEIATTTFAAWAAETGMRATIEDLAATLTSPLRASALTLRDVLVGGAPCIDMARDGNQRVLAAWLAAGAISDKNYAALIALATWPDPVSHTQVGEAIK